MLCPRTHVAWLGFAGGAPLDRPELQLGDRLIESRPPQTLHAAHADRVRGGCCTARGQLQLCKRPVPTRWSRLEQHLKCGATTGLVLLCCIRYEFS